MPAFLLAWFLCACVHVCMRACTCVLAAQPQACLPDQITA